jgi:hypothetical protein
MVEIHELQSDRIRHASPAYTMAVRMPPAAPRVCTEMGQKSGMPIAPTPIADSARSRSSSCLFEMRNSIHHSGIRGLAERLAASSKTRGAGARVHVACATKSSPWCGATGSQMTSARAELIKMGGVGS